MTTVDDTRKEFKRVVEMMVWNTRHASHQRSDSMVIRALMIPVNNEKGTLFLTAVPNFPMRSRDLAQIEVRLESTDEGTSESHTAKIDGRGQARFDNMPFGMYRAVVVD